MGKKKKSPQWWPPGLRSGARPARGSGRRHQELHGASARGARLNDDSGYESGRLPKGHADPGTFARGQGADGDAQRGTHPDPKPEVRWREAESSRRIFSKLELLLSP